MPNCPHCSKEIDYGSINAVPQETMTERLGEVTAKRKEAEKERDALRLVAAQAVKLGARAFGFEDSADALETLEMRYKKAATAGFEGDMIAWFGAENGARADVIAAKFIPKPDAAPALSAPAATSATPPASQTPTPPSAPTPVASASSTVAPGPTTTPRMTADQVAKMNEPLKKQYAQAKSTEERNQIKAKMDENWKLAG